MNYADYMAARVTGGKFAAEYLGSLEGYELAVAVTAAHMAAARESNTATRYELVLAAAFARDYVHRYRNIRHHRNTAATRARARRNAATDTCALVIGIDVI